MILFYFSPEKTMKFVLLTLCFLTQAAFASFPKNNLRIPVDASAKSTMTEAEFNRIIDRLEKVYRPILTAQKATLIISRQWISAAVNASASRFGGSGWYINLYGGMARHPLMTSDGFLFVACHEMGHHLGGAPKIGGLRGYWSSTEGEADYFGGMKCMRRILSGDDNIAFVKDLQVDPLLHEKCSAIYRTENEVALCDRIGMAGKSLGDLLSSLRPGRPATNFHTPNTTVVKKTMKEHPDPQCRLDTYFSAVLCTKSFEEELGKKDPTIGACTKRDGFDLGMRPTCWYKPGRNE
jgi:hypothetical protein